MAAIPLPDPPLSDGVVLLRPWEPHDAPALLAGWMDADVRHFTSAPERPDEVRARRWIERTPSLRESGRSLDLVVTDVVDDHPLGEVGLTAFGRQGGRDAEIGWWVLPLERGRGVAARAADLLATWAVGEPMHLTEVIAWVEWDNLISARVAERAAFTLGDLPGAQARRLRWSRTALEM